MKSGAFLKPQLCRRGELRAGEFSFGSSAAPSAPRGIPRARAVIAGSSRTVTGAEPSTVAGASMPVSPSGPCEQCESVADEVERRDTPALRLDPEVGNPTREVDVDLVDRVPDPRDTLRSGITSGVHIFADETARILVENTECAICR
jgi:hypothetical protein